MASLHAPLPVRAHHRAAAAGVPSSSSSSSMAVHTAAPRAAPSPLPAAAATSRRGRRPSPAVPAALPATNAGCRRWADNADPAVVLAADVGGTNCRFVLSRLTPAALAAAAEAEGGPGGNAAHHHAPGSEAAAVEADTLLAVTYPTKRHATFGDALAALEREPGFVPPSAAALAVAGPVVGGVCAMTNLAWVIDGRALSRASGVPVAVLNDFEAAGYGVLALDHGSAGGGPPTATADIVPLTDAPPQPRGPKVVLGPGTGLGQAQLFWDADDGAYRVWPSEGAHASWGGRGWKQRALAAAVEADLGYCEVEHVACGAGLERIHAFLRSDQAAHRPGADLTGPALAAPAITAAALEAAAAAAAAAGTGPSPPPPSPDAALALEAVDLFLAILGAEAGAMGLRALATGGVYLAGGITPRLIDRIAGPGSGLVDAFLWPASRFSKLLRTFPLYAVTNDGLGLLGARVVAARALARAQRAG